MLEPTYRAAVIGRTGRGDYGHGLDMALVDQARIRLVAVADENPAGLRNAAKRLGVGAAYSDYREMLDREKPQIVAVAPRWIDCHREMIVDCAERGIHVFCEKPLAPDLLSCDEIVATCERKHVKVALAFQTRYSDRFERILELIEEGAIGEVLELRGRGKEDHRGGGEDFMVLGSHILNLILALVGKPTWCFARVTEKGQPISRASVRQGNEGLGPLAGDRIDSTYGFADSPVLAYFATSRPADKAGSNRRFGLQIHGSKGMIVLGTGTVPPAYLSQDPTWTAAGGKSPWIPITSAGVGKPETVSQGDMVAGNRRIVADLIRAIEQDSQPLANVYDARAGIEMILASYASQIQGAPVRLPLEQRERHPLLSL